MIILKHPDQLYFNKDHEMFGGMGFMNEMPISRYYRDVRLISIGGGADEVMCDIIAKSKGY